MPDPTEQLTPPSPTPGKRTSLPRSYLWALLVAGLVAAGLAALLHFSPAAPAPHSPAAVLPVTMPEINPSAVPINVTKKPAQTSETPLMVTLSSGAAGKPVRVGKPVMILAYAELPPGASATLTVSYSRNHGPQALLALVQGSLATIAWTPTLPGQYEFTASAMDVRKNSALSHRLLIAADAAPVLPMPVFVPAPSLPVQVAVTEPSRSVPRVRPRRPVQERSKSARRPNSPELAAGQPAVLHAYHVAAGAFIVRPVAETLAGALRRHGFHASVRLGPILYHKQSYVVETGAYLRPADANRQRDTLKRSGYPAYIFQ